jgi:hypothetical protein
MLIVRFFFRRCKGRNNFSAVAAGRGVPGVQGERTPPAGQLAGPAHRQ